MDLTARRAQLVEGQQGCLGRLEQLRAEAARLEQQVQQFAGAIAILDEQLKALAAAPDAADALHARGVVVPEMVPEMAAAPAGRSRSRAQRRRLAKVNAQGPAD